MGKLTVDIYHDCAYLGPIREHWTLWSYAIEDEKSLVRVWSLHRAIQFWKSFLFDVALCCLEELAHCSRRRVLWG
jgi:hypothetical protein